MPATPLVKFMNQNGGGSRGRLHWGRADIDGAPFRGNAPLMAPEEEIESRLTRIADPKNRTFDLDIPEDNKQYLAAVDKIVNNWAQLIHRKHRTVIMKYKTEDGQRHVKMRVFVYMEWVEYYMEDGKPHLSQRPYIGRTNSES